LISFLVLALSWDDSRMGPRSSSAPNRRANPDVIQKRKAARRFNELLAEAGSGGGKLDGRTEKRRQRMLDELREGRVRSTGRPLKPIDILGRVESLLELGEPLASIKKACKPPRPVPASVQVIAGIKRLHAAYGFRSEAYAFVGIDGPTLKRAGVGPSRPPLAGRKAAAGSADRGSSERAA
jgi:hypothetical protein